jgi:hypothetical protein
MKAKYLIQVNFRGIKKSIGIFTVPQRTLTQLEKDHNFLIDVLDESNDKTTSYNNIIKEAIKQFN